uniref:Uncharacterized protein n=1 Tax=Anopheles albimanus TaxID=7167 RepID=A0A182FUK6_ANOAL
MPTTLCIALQNYVYVPLLPYICDEQHGFICILGYRWPSAARFLQLNRDQVHHTTGRQDKATVRPSNPTTTYHNNPHQHTHQRASKG